MSMTRSAVIVSALWVAQMMVCVASHRTVLAAIGAFGFLVCSAIILAEANKRR
jgi:hypothetical protein